MILFKRTSHKFEPLTLKLKEDTVSCSSQSFGVVENEVQFSILNQTEDTDHTSKVEATIGKSHTTSVALEFTSVAETNSIADLSQSVDQILAYTEIDLVSQALIDNHHFKETEAKSSELNVLVFAILQFSS